MSPQHPNEAIERALQRTITRRTESELAKRNVEFVLAHQNDTPAELAAYLRRCRQELGHVPMRTEIIGGDFIEYRFGSWARALTAAGVAERHIPHSTMRLENTGLYKNEYAAQKLLHQQEKQRKRELNRNRQAQRAANAPPEK